MPWTLSLFLALERSTFDRTWAHPAGIETMPTPRLDPTERGTGCGWSSLGETFCGITLKFGWQCLPPRPLGQHRPRPKSDGAGWQK